MQPAGPSDRVLTRPGEPSRILPGGADPGLATRRAAGRRGPRRPRGAGRPSALGAAARDGLAQALLDAGAARLAAGDADDLARLVPEYVTLPRGVLAAPPDDGGVALTGDEAPR